GLSPTKWNNSARTAAEVTRGKKNSEKALLQAKCQRSSRSKSARSAPVSIKPLACMTPRKFRANGLTHLHGTIGIIASYGPKSACSSSVQLLLPLIFQVPFQAMVTQPFCHNAF